MIPQVDDATFGSLVLSSRTPVLVDFWADWCRPCRGLAPIVEEVAVEYSGRLQVFKLDADENQETAASCAVMALPTLLLLRDGGVVARLTGAVSRERLVREIERVLSPADQTPR